MLLLLFVCIVSIFWIHLLNCLNVPINHIIFKNRNVIFKYLRETYSSLFEYVLIDSNVVIPLSCIFNVVCSISPSHSIIPSQIYYYTHIIITKNLPKKQILYYLDVLCNQQKYFNGLFNKCKGLNLFILPYFQLFVKTY